jgi:glycine/D-amino acid oxidase-like deaminating enzyme
VRLVRAADRGWTELSARTGRALLERCGLLELGPPDDAEFVAARRALEAHAIAHERVDAGEARARWPVEVPDDWVALFTAESGYLRVAACLDALRDEAAAAGATFDYGRQIAEVETGGTRPALRTTDGTRAEADRIVVAVGAWTGALLPALLAGHGRARVSALRRVLAWTAPEAAQRPGLARLPVWAVFGAEGFFYGFPYADEGVAGFKLARHQARGTADDDRPVDPDAVDRTVSEADLEPLRAFLARRIPRALGPFVAGKVCMYGATPSWDFLVDLHPEDHRVVLACGFSGHGFKFAPEIGELVADLAGDGGSTRGLACFRHASHAAPDQ